MKTTATHRLDIQRVVLAATGVALLIAGFASALIAWATLSIDASGKAREEALIERGLDRSLERIVEDVNSATIWNDTVKALSGQPDLVWLQLNLGDYYADYMKHAVTLTYDPTGQLVLASRDSEVVTPASEAAFARAVAPLVSEARQASLTPARRRATGFGAGYSRSALVQVGRETWMVAVSTVVPEDASVARLPVDPVVVSGKPISSLVSMLGPELAISDARFGPVGSRAGSSVIVRDDAGRPLGAVLWTPDLPGRRLLAEAVPIMLGAMLVLLTGALVLFLWIRKVSDALSLNEAELVDARDRAEAANVAKSRFLSNISHELRTPLNGVVGMAEVIAAGDLPSAQRENLDILRESAGHLTNLIEQVLEIARLESGEANIRADIFVPATLIVDTVEQHRADALAKDLRLECRVDNLGLRKGDSRAVAQIVGSLVRNAIAYTPKGVVRVQAHGVGEDVRIVVSDTGVGIADSLLPSLFGAFVQGDDSLTKSYAGAGLGLAICRRLVEAMDGTIAIETRENVGSTFTVTLRLPVAIRAAPQDLRAAAQPFSAAAPNRVAISAST